MCGAVYDFDAAAHDDVDHSYRWSLDLDWSAATARTMHLSLPANDVAIGRPAIDGEAQVGATLTALPGSLSDDDGLPATFEYQWVRVDGDGRSNPHEILGATQSTYRLTSDDAGKRVRVRVRFTDPLGSEEGPLTSAAYPAGTVTSEGDSACARPTLGDRRVIWIGTLTVGVDASAAGYNANTALGELDNTKFSVGHGHVTHTIQALWVPEHGRSEGYLSFNLGNNHYLTATAKQALRLHVCNNDFHFSEASESGLPDYEWNSEEDWSMLSGVKLTVRLSCRRTTRKSRNATPAAGPRSPCRLRCSMPS